MSNIIEVGQLWVVFDSDVYLKVKMVDGNNISYSRVGDSIVHEKSYDDFISYAVNALDVVGQYAHKYREHVIIDVWVVEDSYLVRSDSKEFKMDIGGLYEHYNKIK